MNTIITVIMAVIIQVNSKARDSLLIFSFLMINSDVTRTIAPKIYGKYRASTIAVLNNIVVKFIIGLLYCVFAPTLYVNIEDRGLASRPGCRICEVVLIHEHCTYSVDR